MRVLITRPEPFTHSLCDKLARLNWAVEIFPTIDLQPFPPSARLQAGIDALYTADMAICISRAAVHFGLPLIPAPLTDYPNLQWTAVGPGTADALQTLGLKILFFQKPSLMAQRP